MKRNQLCADVDTLALAARNAACRRVTNQRVVDLADSKQIDQVFNLETKK